MRTEMDNARLWQGLHEGTLQTVGTDHCPFFFDGTKPIIYEGKEIAIPGKELGANEVKVLHHATSGDVTGDYSGVVGYGAAAILKSK